MELLPQTVWATGLVFARIGALMMLIPGIGDQFVPARIRLMVALFLAFVISPVIATRVPALPDAPAMMVALLGGEIIIGLAIGLATRMLYAALATAGAIAAMQTGLAMASAMDPTQGSPTAVFGAFLSILATALVFQTGAHAWFITGAAATYQNFAPGAAMQWGEMADYVTGTFSKSFALGLQITAPLLLFGIVFNIALGIINRVAPAIQVFFIAQPVQILLGIALFMITISGGMLVWLDAVADAGRAMN
jgi:flagellar biosynthesis protein FliR